MAVGNNLPLSGVKAMGLRSTFGTWLAPGGRVAAYVGSAGLFEDTYSENMRVSTLNAGLARCRSGKGDSVILLPGFSESVSSADYLSSLVPGTNIIGLGGFGTGLMPTLNFTATDATVLLNEANCSISGVKFSPSIDGVVNYVNVSASGCYVGGNYFFCGSAAAVDVGTPLIVSVGASDIIVEDNEFLGFGTAVQTNLILVSGTSSLNALKIRNNKLFGSCATTGLINLTGTGSGFWIHDNVLFNTTGTTPLGIRHTDTALTGLIYNNRVAFSTDVTVLAAAISAVGVATAEVRYIENYASDEDSLGGVLSPTATGLE